MQPLGPSLPVPPKTRTALEPGGKHVMLMNLSQPLSAGESVVLNLDFAESGLLRLRAPIRMEPPSSNDG
jgi:copper(I)-binding protein